MYYSSVFFFFFFQAEDGIRDAQESRGLGDVYKRQELSSSSSLSSRGRFLPSAFLVGLAFLVGFAFLAAGAFFFAGAFLADAFLGLGADFSATTLSLIHI
eukprot:TRINITY_DN50604_c0_g1_i1.p3 TRINITY_DN50604_c0_g1~~TRINITY_DN50604_c0_g1_i1.p3  ORF type:complete len:100 (+),score=44.51 TRINITY_DN50604_c0_g1_i1:99-398(+)